MSETEANVLNAEKDSCKNGSFPQASRNRNGSKPRKSMDVEHHAHLDEDIDHSNGSRKIIFDRPSEEFVKKIELSEIIDFDSDEDTFADAESDCEPNQLFLDEMLEDEHPERLNLFDYRRKEQGDSKGGSSSTLSSSDTQNENVIEDSSTSGHDDDDDDRMIRNLNIDDSEPSADPFDGNNDSVSNLPTIRKKGRGRLSMGTSPGVGPGRAMLRQASQKAVWGK